MTTPLGMTSLPASSKRHHLPVPDPPGFRLHGQFWPDEHLLRSSRPRRESLLHQSCESEKPAGKFLLATVGSALGSQLSLRDGSFCGPQSASFPAAERPRGLVESWTAVCATKRLSPKLDEKLDITVERLVIKIVKVECLVDGSVIRSWRSDPPL
jgi:hypothetical protein